MNFDYTKGKRVGYTVSVYNWNGGDRYYFHYLKEAKAFFDKAESGLADGYRLAMYDERTGERRAYVKCVNGYKIPVITL